MDGTAILDFDGTIFSNGFIDIGLLKEIASRHKEILIVSNNSSIAQNTIESYLTPYLKYVLTPQVLAKAIFQNTSIKSEVCCSEEVFKYLKDEFYSSNFEIRNFLKEASVNSSNQFLEEFNLSKVALIGKVDSKKLSKLIKYYLSKQYVLVGMNRDKFEDSQGIFKETNLVGDLYGFKFDLGKTSDSFLSLIKNYCNNFNLDPLVVYGDNAQSDGKLAFLLGITFKRTIFAKSEFSDLVPIK